MPEPLRPNYLPAALLAQALDGRDAPLLLDASYYLPSEPQDAEALYQAARLPGAQRFDLDAVADPFSTLPHMLPSLPRLEAALASWSWRPGQKIVLYDQKGLFSSPRAAWSLAEFGLETAVLIGGLPAWREQGLPLETEGTAPTVTPSPLPQLARRQTSVASLDAVKMALSDGSAQVIDARDALRFSGEAPEPRAGLRSGHMPGALNLPFTELLSADKRDFRPLAALKAAFQKAGVDLSRPIITSCGSGITAAILLEAALRAGATSVRLYDGSWAQWGDPRAATPVATGA